MRDNKALWITFGVLQQIASWVALVVWVGIKYGTVISKNGLVVTFAVALVFAIWMIMYSLKETAEHGYGVFRKIARGLRKLIPLSILLAAILVINTNIADIVPVIVYGLIGNIIAIPFGIVSYYAGPQHTEDTVANRIIDKM